MANIDPTITVRTQTVRIRQGKDGVTAVDMVLEYQDRLSGEWKPLKDGEVTMYVDGEGDDVADDGGGGDTPHPDDPIPDNPVVYEFTAAYRLSLPLDHTGPARKALTRHHTGRDAEFPPLGMDTPEWLSAKKNARQGSIVTMKVAIRADGTATYEIVGVEQKY